MSIILVGGMDYPSQLEQLTATGRIFRFLLTPLSNGQTRLALEAAVTQHLDLAAQGQRLSSASGGSAGDSKNYLITYGALAAGLLVVVGGIWFGISHFTREPEPPPAVALPSASDPQSGVPERPDPIQAELALAKEAFNAGKYLEPAGESALDLYRSALALDPNSEAAKEGIRDVVDKVLERAEAALTAERLEEASNRIEIARDIDPTHPRLAFLDTQMARERERLKLTQAQEVGNRVRQLVAQANDRMQNGRLIGNTSAREALVEARRLDASDPGVTQAIRDVAGQIADEARKALAAGRNDEAQTYVSVGRQLGTVNAQLAAVERQLGEASQEATRG